MGPPPGAGGAGGGDAGIGGAFSRGSSSRDHLNIKWNFPVYVPKGEKAGNESRSERLRKALNLKEAFAIIAGDDPRPLLVLRECLTCTGTDDALLTRQADNEKTMLMSRWFNCVKLPADVIDQDHPFHSIFSDEKPSHLFAATKDGSQRLNLAGDQSRTELWKAMGDTLNSQYSTKYKMQLKKLSSMLTRFDELDQKLGLANGKLEDAIEKYGPKSKKMAKADAKVRELRIAKGDLDKEMEKHSKMMLKQKTKADKTKKS